MDEELFAQLYESVKQMDKIVKGKRKPSRVYEFDEPRFVVIGKISDTHWSIIVTYRGEKIRIISVRRSRREEIEIYES